MPSFDAHQIVEGVFQNEMSFGTDFDVSRFAEASDHRGLFTIERDSRTMEDFFRLLQEEVHVVHTAVEQRPEETWNQNSTNTYEHRIHRSAIDAGRLTKAFHSILQTNGDGQGCIVFEELVDKGIPPLIITFLDEQRRTSTSSLDLNLTSVLIDRRLFKSCIRYSGDGGAGGNDGLKQRIDPKNDKNSEDRYRKDRMC